MKMVKIGTFWGGKNVVIKFCVGRKYFFLKTVSKIISVRFINITIVKSGINGVNLDRTFLVKMVKIVTFCGQNEAISQNFGKVVKKIFSENWKNFEGGSPWMNFTKNVIKGVIFAKICIFWYFL